MDYINDAVFDDRIQGSIVLVKFSAKHCIPCHLSDTIIAYLEEEYRGAGFVCYDADIDDNVLHREKYNILTVPTFLLFNNGHIIIRVNGYGNTTKAKLVTGIESLLCV